MDSRAAEDYHAELLKKLHRTKPSTERLLWVPILGVSGWFAFGTISGSAFGAVLGWGICSVLSTLDDLARQQWYVEYMRHLYEHTGEAEAGKDRFDFDAKIEKALRRWWQF